MIQLSRTERSVFYRRTVSSFAWFIVALSLGANIFFLVTLRGVRDPGPAVPSELPPPLLLSAQAYGNVNRGFQRTPRTTVGSGSLAPPSSYRLPQGDFPSFTAGLPLYRDQGIRLDDASLAAIFEELGLEMEWQDLDLLPVRQRFRSADRTMDVTVDIEKRALTLSRLGTFGPAPEGRADDAVSIAIARKFVDDLGIDLSVHGSPVIAERMVEGVGSRTYVAWPMTFSSQPLLDMEGRPVPAVQVQVGRLSRKALSMTVTLLHPRRLALSSYPRASKELMEEGLLQGGIVPIASDLPGTPQDVIFTGVRRAFVLMPATLVHPMYIVPVLLADWTQGKHRGSTFVPALDPEHFTWIPKQ